VTAIGARTTYEDAPQVFGVWLVCLCVLGRRVVHRPV